MFGRFRHGAGVVVCAGSPSPGCDRPIERGYESYVAKDEASAYVGGRAVVVEGQGVSGWTVESDGVAEDWR